MSKKISEKIFLSRNWTKMDLNGPKMKLSIIFLKSALRSRLLYIHCFLKKILGCPKKIDLLMELGFTMCYILKQAIK